MTEYGENHFVTDGVYLTTDEKKDGWQLTVEAELAWNRQPEGGTDTYCVEISVTDYQGHLWQKNVVHYTEKKLCLTTY